MPSLEAIYASALEPCAAEFAPPPLMARAERATGLIDWGGPRWSEEHFRARLDALCHGLEADARLHAIGRSRAHSRLHVLLCSRLLQVDRRRRIEHAPLLTAPLVGTGLPRAGSTFLHGLLACVPDNRVATAAQAAIPVVAPVDDDVRTALYARILAFQGFTAPDVLAIHPYAADAPEECVFMQEGACGTPLGAFYNVPGFAALARGGEAVADGLAWQRGIMQTLQGDGTTGRWLLKAPSHIIHIGALFAAFPDARVFFNHRDPAKVIPSMASLYMKLYSLASDDSVDPLELGPLLVANWGAILDRFDAWRDANPRVSIVDVHYTGLIADPIATARRLYRTLGLELSDAALKLMAAHLATDHHGKGPARRYGLAEFGLREEDIERAFGGYIERHGVKREARR